jgi:hypothetical protein
MEPKMADNVNVGTDLMPTQNQSNTINVFANKDNFETAQRMAKSLCNSTIVPENYRGEQNIGNCIVALNVASRIGVDPLSVMQNLYVIKGKPAWSAKALIGMLNACGKFAPLRFEFDGAEGTDAWRCRAYTTDKNGELLQGSWISIAMAKEEGWYNRAGSKWLTMPEQMLQYRAASFFCSLYAPDISLGIYTQEEVQDIPEKPIKKSFSKTTAKQIEDIPIAEVVENDAVVVECRADVLAKFEEINLMIATIVDCETANYVMQELATIEHKGTSEYYAKSKFEEKIKALNLEYNEETKLYSEKEVA